MKTLNHAENIYMETSLEKSLTVLQFLYSMTRGMTLTLSDSGVTLGKCNSGSGLRHTKFGSGVGKTTGAPAELRLRQLRRTALICYCFILCLHSFFFSFGQNLRGLELLKNR